MGSNDKTKTRLLRRMGEAIADFGMIDNGDRIMVCLSGGKDSHTMLDLLLDIRDRAPVRFELSPSISIKNSPDFLLTSCLHISQKWAFRFASSSEDTYSIVKRLVPEGKTYCSVCSRLRRGILYNIAVEEGCNKIALGHHADDIITTLLLNLFYVGSLKAMPPKLRSNDGRNTVIRPLAYCSERDIADYAASREVSDHSVRSVRVADKSETRPDQEPDRRSSKRRFRTFARRCSTRSETSCRRICWIISCSTLRTFFTPRLAISKLNWNRWAN